MWYRWVYSFERTRYGLCQTNVLLGHSMRGARFFLALVGFCLPIASFVAAPASLGLNQNTDQSSSDIPTVAFCDIVRDPELLFNHTIRTTAVFEQAEEGQYLTDPECPLGHDDQIGVGFAPSTPQIVEAHNAIIQQIGSSHFGGRGIVTITGILRNTSRHDFAWYRFRFDIVEIESLAHIVEPFKGSLQTGKTYSATVIAAQQEKLVFDNRIPVLPHTALRIEWENLNLLPPAVRQGKQSKPVRIIFSVLNDDVRQVSERRWNRTVRCAIVDCAPLNSGP